MWTYILGNDYAIASRNKKKKMKSKYKAQTIPVPAFTYSGLQFGTLETNPCPTIDIQKEETMDTKDQALSYLTHRLQNIWYDKQAELEKKFNLRGIRPSSKKELTEWLKTGNYRIVENYPCGYETDEDAFEDYGWNHFFAWGKDAPDRKGYEKAIEKLLEAKQAALDIISVKTDEDARLDALRAFEAA